MSSKIKKPTKEEAMQAVQTLLSWAGEDISKDSLQKTPKRVTEAYLEWFSGYGEDENFEEIRLFDDLSGFDGLIVQKDISFYSHCEHHMAPVIGKAHIGYIPNGKVIGLSKFTRLINIYARRLTMQERLTKEIHDAIEKLIKPKGAAVIIDAEHLCMSSRGVNKENVITTTQSFSGIFKENNQLISDFFRHVKN